MPNYAIIDIETTGTTANAERITEIAVFIHNGREVINEMHSLINPEKKIPYRITQLTGIDNKMVQGAPKFFEIARQLVEITEGCIFVAHNSAFDYNFVRAEFRRLGYNYQREQLCTVKLSKKLLPGHASYSLGRLCDDLDIHIQNRHRASGDAMATVKLFEKLLDIEKQPEHADLRGLDTQISRKILETMPRECGVYYFHDAHGEVIYVGKSTNIRSRILSHLSNNNTKKAIEMRARACSLSYEITGSELAALLFESHEIKRLMPIFNRAQRRRGFSFGWFLQEDEEGYLRLTAESCNGTKTPVLAFSTAKTARESLFQLCEQHQLCQKLCGLYKSQGACFQHSIHQCKGACIGEESPEAYNKRLNKALSPYFFENKNFAIREPGRNDEEECIVLVENGIYLGFGYIQKTESSFSRPEEVKNIINSFPDDRDKQQIIKSYLRQHKPKTFLF